MRPIFPFDRKQSTSSPSNNVRSGVLLVGLILLALPLIMSSARAQESAKSSAGLTGVMGGSTSLGDIDGDGNLDLVVTGEDATESPTATVYLGDGSGSFTEAGADLTGVAGGSTSLGDIDGDGNLDLVVVGEDPNGRPTAKAYLGDGSGGFTESETGLTGVYHGSTSLADLNRDDNLDLVVSGSTAKKGPPDDPPTKVYLGDGSGGLTEGGTGLPVGAGSSSLGDIDGDGTLDLVVTGMDMAEKEPVGPATLYLGDGSGGFTDAEAGLIGVLGGVTSLGDFNEDGNLDLVLSGLGGTDDTITNYTKVYLGDGSGGFEEASAGLTGVHSGSHSLGDLNGDGTLDLVVTGTTAKLSRSNQRKSSLATVYLGDGSGDFTEAGANLPGVLNSSTSLGNIDGDENLDLVVIGEDANGSPTAKVYLGDGSGGFTEVGAN